MITIINGLHKGDVIWCEGKGIGQTLSLVSGQFFQKIVENCFGQCMIKLVSWILVEFKSVQELLRERKEKKRKKIDGEEEKKDIKRSVQELTNLKMRQ